MGKHHPADLALKKRSPHKIQPLLQVETSHALALKCATRSTRAPRFQHAKRWAVAIQIVGMKKKGWTPQMATLNHIEPYSLVKIWNHVYRVCRVYLRWVETIIQYSWLHRQLSAGNCLRGLACNHSSALCSHFPAL
jgi:hypothetical protein